MYIHARIRKYVIGGADLPPPTLNRVNNLFLRNNDISGKFKLQNTHWREFVLQWGKIIKGII